MNIWTLNKDNALRRFLLKLAELFGPDAFAMSGRWKNDENAIGLYQPGEESSLAYVFTYGQDTGRYGLHLEYPNMDGAAVATTAENLELNHLLDLLRAHFNI